MEAVIDEKPGCGGISSASREEKLALILALEEREKRRRVNPIAHFHPHNRQREFLQVPPAKWLGIFVGGNKSGKSYVGVAKAIAHAYGYYPWLVPDLCLGADGDLPDRSQVPIEAWVRRGDGLPIAVPNVGMYVTGQSRAQGIGQVLWPIFEELLPITVRQHPNYRAHKGAMGVVTHVDLPNGSTVHFGSAEQDEVSFEGFRIQWAGVDEPVRPFIFNGLLRGLALDFGPIWFTLTPLTARCAWIYTTLVQPRPAHVHTVQVHQSDNPYFSEEARRSFEQSGSWTESEKRARLYGEWEALGQRIIHTWDPRVHVIPSKPLPSTWPRGIVVDPHHVRPAFVLWYKVSPWGVYHFYREWPPGDFFKMTTGGKSPSEYAALFRNIEGPEPSQFRVADPRFGKAEYTLHGIKQEDLPTSWADQMEAAGMAFDTRVHGVGRVETGEQKIIDMFRFNKDVAIGPTNTPKILVHDSCPNLITAFDNYGIVSERDPTKGYPERPSLEFKDPIDCVRYAVLYGLPPTEITSEMGESFSDVELMKENECFNGLFSQ